MERIGTMTADWQPSVKAEKVGAGGLTASQLRDLLAPLVAAYQGVEMDTAAAWRAYWHAVDDVTPPVLMLAVSNLIKGGGKFFPRPSELRAACGEAQRQIRAQHPYEGCAACEHAPGWVALTTDGVERMTRCPCWNAHRAKLTQLGVGQPVTRQLTSGEEA